MDNEALARQIKDAIADATGEIRRDIGRLEGLSEAHRKDAFAHREMVATYSSEQQDWMRWRGRVDTRFAYFGGGLAVLTFSVSVFGAFVAQHVFR